MSTKQDSFGKYIPISLFFLFVGLFGSLSSFVSCTQDSGNEAASEATIKKEQTDKESIDNDATVRPEKTPDKKPSCTGVKLPKSAWKKPEGFDAEPKNAHEENQQDSGEPVQADAGEMIPESTGKEVDPCVAEPGKCVGKTSPKFRLQDIQPQSCSYQAYYGLDAFKGKITFVALLAAWCSYCQGQSEKLEKMKVELKLAGVDVHFVIINKDDAIADQEEFKKRVSFPILQDKVNQGVWALLNGAKDDFYLYDKEGKLLFYMPNTSPNNYLSDDANYKLLKDIIIKASKK